MVLLTYCLLRWNKHTRIYKGIYICQNIHGQLVYCFFNLWCQTMWRKQGYISGWWLRNAEENHSHYFKSMIHQNDETDGDIVCGIVKVEKFFWSSMWMYNIYEVQMEFYMMAIRSYMLLLLECQEIKKQYVQEMSIDKISALRCMSWH